MPMASPLRSINSANQPLARVIHPEQISRNTTASNRAYTLPRGQGIHPLSGGSASSAPPGVPGPKRRECNHDCCTQTRLKFPFIALRCTQPKGLERDLG